MRSNMRRLASPCEASAPERAWTSAMGSTLMSAVDGGTPHRRQRDAELGPHGLDPRIDVCADPTGLGPLARVAFLAPLSGAVDAHLAAPEGLAGAVIELVDRPIDEGEIALRIQVGQEPPRNLPQIL